jgi:hypothetical protein
VTADLRDASGAVRGLRLGAAGPTARTVGARLPAGRWEVEALELDEPAGLAATNGHQNAENVAAGTQFAAGLTVGPLTALGRTGARLESVELGGWRGVGAAGVTRGGAQAAAIRFATTGQPGVVRPVQPSDSRPLPVLVDPRTAGAAAGGRGIELTVDGLPVFARVVGVLRRFPTIAPDAAGFVVADGDALGAALDAQLPGQGLAGELWISTRHPGRLAAAVRRGPLAGLGVSLRTDVERRLRAAPVARAVVRTLFAATVVSGGLAVLGLLVALLGSGRDPAVERDLVELGVGPRALRRELLIRLMICAVAGVVAGWAVAVFLTRLAVAAVRAAGTIAVPRPPLVTVVPWGELAVWGLVVLGALGFAGLLAARRAGSGSAARSRPRGAGAARRRARSARRGTV